MASYYVDLVNGNDANDGGGWWKLALTTGVGAQPVAGETVTGAGGATGIVIKITGTWATTSTVYMYARNATVFANGEAITFSGGGSCANAQGTPYDSVVASFKTIKKTFAAGDIIQGAKSVETALAGTVAAVLGSSTVNADSASGQKVLKVAATTSFRVGNPVNIGAGTARSEVGQIASIQAGTSLTLVANLTYTHTAVQGDAVASPCTVVLDTTDDLTGVLATYSFIRINNGSTIYMVWARTSSTITLCRPYRGDIGSGYGATSLAAPVIASGDLTPTAGTGTVANPITLNWGINPSNNSQDGFTVINANNASYGWSSSARVFWNTSNLGIYYTSSGAWGNGTHTDCTFTNCFTFRSPYFTNGGVFHRSTFTNMVCEASRFHYVGWLNCNIVSLETGNPGSVSIVLGSTSANTTFTGWRNAGYTAYSALQLGGIGLINIRFIDPIFDELASGCTNVEVASNTGIYSGFVLVNPTIGYGTLVSYPSYNYNGSIAFQNINGNYQDNRTYFGSGDATSKYYILSSDTVTYNSGPISAKITSVGPSVFPLTIRHYIPCNAGVAKTLSVYLRKSSSPAYGSTNLPFMRLRWLTGTAPNLVSNVHDSAMSDTNDSFVQVSYSVIPSVQGVIIMELIFQPGANNALAWYDDIGVA